MGRRLSRSPQRFCAGVGSFGVVISEVKDSRKAFSNCRFYARVVM